MPFDVAKRTVDYIFSEPRLNSADNVVLDFIGGEPLLEIRLIDDIIRYFLTTAAVIGHSWLKKYKIRITTNGLLYATSDVQEFIKRHRKHLEISISIDGNRTKTNTARIFPDGTGSYDKIVDAIPLWRKQFPKEGTKMTISHNDLPFVFESVKHLISLHIHKIDVNPVLENVWKENDDALLTQQLIMCADYIIDNNLYETVFLSCFGDIPVTQTEKAPPFTYGVCGSFTFAVDYTGNFYTCLRFAKFSLRDKAARPIGNINMGVNWNLMRPFHSFCNRITSERCISCDIQQGCKICPAENYDCSETASIFEQSLAACKMHRAKIKAKNYYRNKLSFALSAQHYE